MKLVNNIGHCVVKVIPLSIALIISDVLQIILFALGILSIVVEMIIKLRKWYKNNKFENLDELHKIINESTERFKNL